MTYGWVFGCNGVVCPSSPSLSRPEVSVLSIWKISESAPRRSRLMVCMQPSKRNGRSNAKSRRRSKVSSKPFCKVREWASGLQLLLSAFWESCWDLFPQLFSTCLSVILKMILPVSGYLIQRISKYEHHIFLKTFKNNKIIKINKR